MYVPPAFAENQVERLEAFIGQHPLATLVAASPEGLEASHLPLILEAGRLRGHLARANPQSHILDGAQVLAIFTGPQHYISPNWYPSKDEHGRVVPTWNYVAVHVSGRAKLFDDLLPYLTELTDRSEAGFPVPWRVADAPAQYIENLTRAIVGVEIAIDRMEGKWKMSQNRSAADRAGVIEGLETLGSPASLEVANLMRLRDIPPSS